MATDATEDPVDLLAHYQLESGTVVHVVGRTHDKLTLAEHESGARYPVRRGPFTDDVRSGHIQRVEARWVVGE